MPIKGSEILKLVLLKLKEAGLKDGSELELNLVEKAIKALGYYDRRTIKKYSEALLESSYVRTEEKYKEVKRPKRLTREEFQQRLQSEKWDNQKIDVYKKVFLHGPFALEEGDLDLLDAKDIIVEKRYVEKKVFIDHFP